MIMLVVVAPKELQDLSRPWSGTAAFRNKDSKDLTELPRFVQREENDAKGIQTESDGIADLRRDGQRFILRKQIGNEYFTTGPRRSISWLGALYAGSTIAWQADESTRCDITETGWAHESDLRCAHKIWSPMCSQMWSLVSIKWKCGGSSSFLNYVMQQILTADSSTREKDFDTISPLLSNSYV